MKRINSLLLKNEKKSDDVLPDHEIKKSDLYAQMSVKLASSERRAEELELRITQMKDEWSAALADSEFAKKSMEDMQSKHMKRWSELTDENGQSGDAQTD